MNNQPTHQGQNQPAPPGQIPLSLPPDAQWFVHHLVSLRLQRPDSAFAGFTPETSRTVYRKLEEGDHGFTLGELRYLQTEIFECLRTQAAAPRNEAVARQALDQIGSALGSEGLPR